MIDIKHIGSPNGWLGRRDAYGNEYKVEAVMLHVMEGWLYGSDAWLTNPESGVSAHYGIGGTTKEEVHRYINEWDTAWHTGGNANGKWSFLGLPKDRPNFYTIGIELEGGFNGEAIHKKTLDKAVELVADICLRHNLPVNRERIIGHSDVNQVSRQNCPGIDLDNFVARVVEYIAKLNPEPSWKLEVLSIDPKTFSPHNDYSLVNLDNGQIVAAFSKDTPITVSYSYGDYYMTEYSFNKNLKHGFSKAQLEFITPDNIVYFIEPQPNKTIVDLELAQLQFNQAKEKISPGEIIRLIKHNLTTDNRTILEEFTKESSGKPVDPMPKPLKPKQNIFELIVNFILSFIKRK